IGACISTEPDERGNSRILVDGDRCISCGACFDICEHNARDFTDDTERFFEDLERGEKISLLVAPSFPANYPDTYKRVFGRLKTLGVNRIINVSFGADITTWGYINYIQKHDFLGGISQPCPAVVGYIERYMPELLPRLFPVQSPLMCAAIYARKEMGITGKFAFISPCIAKKLEIDDPHNEGLVQYNVTFEHLMKYVREHDIKGPSVHSEIEYGLGSFYPTPGGLAENVRWFLGDSVYIRQVEGERHLYEWLHFNKDRIREGSTPFLFIDALNCEKGCICGTAVSTEKSRTDDALYALLDIRERSKKDRDGDAWSRNASPEERLARFNEQFKDLKLEDYLREYTDLSDCCGYELPDDEELEEIFTSMNKFTEDSRHIDCTCCGYDSCRQMATAIYNGFNHKENCIYYERTMVKELELEKTIAEEATKAKSAFLANMSHEIRTPINAVLGMNEMVLRECEDPNIIIYSENIKSAGTTLLGLVNNILDFSKIEAGKMEIDPAEYDLSSLINDLVNMIQVRVDDKDLLLNLEIDPDIPKVLFGDEIRIKQIITNILTNAVKYTEKGSITFRVGYERMQDEPDHIELLVTVEDTGIGIRKEDLSKLFEQFDRIEEKRNRHIEGTGLGMNITKKLLEMMGSDIEVSSEYGKGSSFGFRLKQRVIRWEKLGDFQKEYRRHAKQKKEYRELFTAPDAEVLVIDDNPMNLMVFKSLLKQTKIKIDTADSGDEGLRLSGDKKYDIIFFDHMMPRKDGIETLHELREQKSNPNLTTTAICLTANAISGARENYISAGFDDYLSKPIDSKKLEDMLCRYLPLEKIVTKQEEEEPEEDHGEDNEMLASLREFDGIDVKSGLKNSGSVDAYIPLLKIFYESMDEKGAEIQGFYDEGNIRDYTIKVHALKSSARIIGAAAFGEKAQALENAGKEEDLAYIRENHTSFMEEFETFREPLRALFEKEEEADRPLADEYLLEEVFEEIRSAAEAMDCDRLEGVFAEMAEYRIPEDKAELYKSLHSAADALDYDAILSLLAEGG
ncbi:MAG: response regulator, partial [Lachnospiraceae bacterium]|nr:response regulator [Lachnospiraceae bacterium]